MGEFRGVFIGPLNQMPKNLPATIFATEWAPFGSLFDAASAVVHPAAIGTGALAIRAGIPQLLVPMAHDQFDNAAHFTKLGVASLLPPARYKAKAVVRELRQLVLDSDVRNNTRALQERLVREPKAEQIAANLICDFINRRGPRAAPGPRVSSVAV
jgi:rhamnosyltransferase subunit B